MSSWFSSKTEKRASPIQGRGLFARVAITAGEIVAVKGGAIMDSATLSPVRDEVSPAEIQIEHDLYIASCSTVEVEANILSLNHSCMEDSAGDMRVSPRAPGAQALRWPSPLHARHGG